MRWVWVEFWEAHRKNMCKSKSILRYETFSCRSFCDIGSSSEKRWLSAKCQNQVHLTLDLLTLAIWWRWWCLLIWWWYIYILQAVNLDPDLAFVLQNAAQELAVTHTQHWTVMLKRFTITLMIMIHSKNWEQSKHNSRSSRRRLFYLFVLCLTEAQIWLRSRDILAVRLKHLQRTLYTMLLRFWCRKCGKVQDFPSKEL